LTILTYVIESGKKMMWVNALPGTKQEPDLTQRLAISNEKGYLLRYQVVDKYL